MNRKRVLIDSNVLLQKALSLYEDFSKGSPEMNGHLLQLKDSHRFKYRFRLKNIKITGATVC